MTASTATGVILVRQREVYGNTLFYPANSNAECACKLTGCKTLSRADMRTLECLGFTIQLEQAPNPLEA